MKVILAAVLKGTWKRMLSMGSFWKTIGNGFRASWTQIRRDLIVNTRNQQPMKTKSETAETFHDDQTPMRKRKNSEMTELEGNADVFQRKWMIFITGVKSISWQKKKSDSDWWKNHLIRKNSAPRGHSRSKRSKFWTIIINGKKNMTGIENGWKSLETCSNRRTGNFVIKKTFFSFHCELKWNLICNDQLTYLLRSFWGISARFIFETCHLIIILLIS